MRFNEGDTSTCRLQRCADRPNLLHRNFNMRQATECAKPNLYLRFSARTIEIKTRNKNKTKKKQKEVDTFLFFCYVKQSFCK
jgi:hypothetical protein